ncbi:uncharacterized protein LOC129747259 [Uranotaenia lowii]|uniref:uncharacterized protein LOC129747259 n=1 Tax=Uranotaenia lowii TaxID=190385 RepID=UPI00247989AA|nr:uncharacterized protein LOC129747259 [Uranotaenia lowii]XP_055597344.1 uncharacterized protein LOC129747259 [Uranotaenia lowii]XP_055597345.1 uncharacterized protein LOC129747259 [Uranotaenia lowii]
MAARQVMSRDLPNFSGDPADWPAFITFFTSSTIACGYSPTENLFRLQRCLKGAALNCVRSRLHLPQAVPYIIRTLKSTFGRPELLINMLLEKVRSVPSPKADKLDTLIEFGMVVQSLCDHLEAAGQTSHLNNPTLLSHLVNKLPTCYQLQWAEFIENLSDENLGDFNEFISRLARFASRVTLYNGSSEFYSEDKRKMKRGNVNAHTETQVRVPEEPRKLCLACGGEQHRLKDCVVFQSFDVEGRWRFVQNQGLCRNCLNSHGRRPCRVPGCCGVAGCNSRHHPLLHNPPAHSSSNASPVVSMENHSHRSSSHSLLFKIVPVTLYGNDAVVNTYAFLDDGSSLTMVEESLLEQLNIEGVKQPLCLTWTGNVSRVEKNSEVVQLSISSGQGKPMQLRNARSVRHLSLSQQSLDFERIAVDCPHLRGLPIKSYTKAIPKLLIGIDNLHLIAPLKLREGRTEQPVAVKTRLGWCLFGGSSESQKSSTLNVHQCKCSGDDSLHSLVKDFFSTENIPPKPTIELIPREEQRALKILEATTKRIGNRYETGLLWRFDHFEMPESYSMAEKRSACLARRMQRDPELRENLVKQIDGYVTKGYAHRATEQELATGDPRRVWYLPLGAVTNPRKPGKVRLIWDAAAKVCGVSLNSMLLKGPDQLTSLPSVLFRFRQFQVAISADIKEMYHQVAIRKEDRHAQRFLWREDPGKPAETFVMDVATFGSTCSPASAQYVKNRNAADFVDQFPRAVNGIMHGTYVDDYYDSFEQLEEAEQVALQVQTIHSRAGFQLHEWRSNRPQILEKLGQTASIETKSLSIEIDKIERVLGLLWRPREDVLGFHTELPAELKAAMSSPSAPTKRQVLRCLMSLFDPLGLLSIYTVQGKIILQEIWRSGIQWDERIEDNIFHRWQQWTALFPNIQKLQFPRCYFSTASAALYHRLELHIFVDASEDAYAAAAYFRTTNLNGMASVVLVAAKTKVAPLKPTSIPRMELQAAVLGVNLANFVAENHQICIRNRIFWSDSRTVLAWLNSDGRRYQKYVALRIGHILTETNPAEWRWVPSDRNPADLATKWGKGPQLELSSTWLQGPQFLQQSEEAWPSTPTPCLPVEIELRPVHVHQAVLMFPALINLFRFSKWKRALRAMAYVFRYKENLKRTTQKQEKNIGTLSQEELETAHDWMVVMTQWQCYPIEMTALNCTNESREQLPTVDRSSSIYKLSPIVDQKGMLRIDSRLQAAVDIPWSMKFPIILPECHRLTELIVASFHEQHFHANSETVVNELRQVYHIPKVRVVVKRIVRNCQWCKVKKVLPRVPRMAALPTPRLATLVRPFTFVGLDLFGPLTVKVGRSQVKRWVALFTCLTIRAVHVEVVHNLSTQSCIMSIRRFIGRRGPPAEIHSDNGTNFYGASRVLQEQMKAVHDDLATTFTTTTTKWVFIPPGTPHMGGSWERMVRSIKTAMEAANGERSLDDEALLTLTIDAEYMVNSRPLTYMPLESNESEALTPNHFLHCSSKGIKPPTAQPTNVVDALRTTLGQVNQQLDIFWHRWIQEYLPTLTRRTKWFEEVPPIAEGNLVVIIDESKRNNWVRGRVVKLLPGADGRVRRALVQTSKGGLIKRAVAKLAILDVAKDGKADPDHSDDQRYGGDDVADGKAGNPSSVEQKAPQGTTSSE